MSHGSFSFARDETMLVRTLGYREAVGNVPVRSRRGSDPARGAYELAKERTEIGRSPDVARKD
ncbi:MAG TPA: hypothetical protein VK116_17680 [Planctomycetota bacterium]|nr:hypothetical protein [Planctomycetota bacterium]